MATTEQITSIAKDNLFLIFGGESKEKRLELLEKLWHPSGEVLFLEPGAISTTYEEIDAIIVGLQKDAPGFVFKIVGESSKEAKTERRMW